jgi:ubiquinone/menaquinone biosynthesis C-methylase UbiE
VGETGKVVGVDFTEKMVEKARANAQKLGYENVEFHLGDIEDLPVRDNFADVVVSNCVMNLVPDKVQAFSETYRVLKPGGHFSISDIVIKGSLPQTLQQDAEMYVGCVAGASPKEEYLKIIENAGFQHITLQKERKISLPASLLEKYLSAEEFEKFKSEETGIFSITVYAEKPLV